MVDVQIKDLTVDKRVHWVLYGQFGCSHTILRAANGREQSFIIFINIG